MRTEESIKEECFKSIKKTLDARLDCILAEDYDRAETLLKKADANVLFARDLELLGNEEYMYLLGRMMNDTN